MGVTFFWVGVDDVGVCAIFSGWVCVEVIFFWVVVGGCDIFLGGCVTFLWVGVGGCDIFLCGCGRV